jgi:aspartate aminotransferase/aminotransferase
MAHPVDFSIGQPHFDAPAPIQRAAMEAISAGRNRYTPTQGIPALNDRVRQHLEARLGRSFGQTLITSGVSGGLTLAFLALLDPGDQILLPDPHFVLYRILAESLGIEPVYYDLHPDFRLTRAALEEASTDRTKALLINSPSNPTGAVHSEEELEIAAAFARERGLTVISDDIYESFVYDAPLASIARHLPDALVLSGFSKTYAIPGWRLGYAAGPADVIDAMGRFQQFTFVCAHSPSQYAALVALDLDMSSYRDDYRRKRDRICELLEPHYRLIRPGGSFYVYPELPAGESGAAFAERCLDREILIVPGTAFSRRDSHFRLSFAVSDEDLERGAGLLNELV